MKQIPAFVISLADNSDRRAHMAKTLASQQIAFEFFNACDGRGKPPCSLNPHYSEERAQLKLGYKMIGSQVATATSHLNLYKRILADGYPCALIMEDDIRFVRSIKPLLANINLLPHDWDVVSLCYYRNNNTLRHYVLSLRGRRPLAGAFQAAFFTENMHSTAAYLISASGAEKMVATLERGFCEPIDHYLGDFRRHQLYAVVPKPVEIDLMLGLASNVSKERMMLACDSIAEDDLVRALFRRSGLFPLAKKINLARFEWQKPISQFFYVATHPWLLLWRTTVSPNK